MPLPLAAPWRGSSQSISVTQLMGKSYLFSYLNTMKTLSDFKASLSANQPEDELSIPLKSLWYDAKGNWDKAHAQVDQLNDQQSAWIHAYLHRKEGDVWNADYWYRKAARTRPNISLEQEWEQLALHFLSAG